MTYDYAVRDDLPLMHVTVNFSGTAPLITTQELPAGKLYSYYTAYVNTSGDALVHSDVSGLPDGLSALLVPSHSTPGRSVYIYGTPTESGSFDVSVLVSNDYGQDTKTFTLYIASASEPIKINAENFPDRVFRNYISANYDTNNDGELDYDEINAIKTFPADFAYTVSPSTGITITNLVSLNITNLKGIEYLTALETVCLPQGVTQADLSNKLSLDAFFMNGADLESLDLSGDAELRVLGITDLKPIIYMCPPTIREWPHRFPRIEYLDIESGDISELDLDEYEHLKWGHIGDQNIEGELASADNTEYPYAFDFRVVVSEDNLPRIDRDSTQVLDDSGDSLEYVFDNWILRFKEIPSVIKYRYDTGALNIFMDVTITIKYEYLIVRPEFTITDEDVPEGEEGKSYIFDITVTGTGPFKWRITGGYLPNGLTLDEDTGRITGIPTVTGDFRVTITVSNKLYSVSITIIIRIRTATTTRPTITVPTIRVGTVGVLYEITFGASGTGPFVWSLSGNYPSWISINSSTGRLSGTPASAGTFTFTVIVTDTGIGLTASYEITIRIREASQQNTLSITTTNIYNGTVGVSYDFAFIASGTGAITWRIIKGTLPNGLELNGNTGRISGTPTESGTFEFTIEASSGSVSVTKKFTLIIIGSSDPSVNTKPTITTSTLTDGTINVSYYFRFIAAGSGTITWRISSGNLPTGLTVSTSGELTGIPTVTGTFRFKIIAENDIG